MTKHLAPEIQGLPKAEEIQRIANSAARAAGYGRATHIQFRNIAELEVISHVPCGYRKSTTGEYVSNAYRQNFGWKNTYYQPAVTTVAVPFDLKAAWYSPRGCFPSYLMED